MEYTKKTWIASTNYRLYSFQKWIRCMLTLVDIKDPKAWCYHTLSWNRKKNLAEEFKRKDTGFGKTRWYVECVQSGGESTEKSTEAIMIELIPMREEVKILNERVAAAAAATAAPEPQLKQKEGKGKLDVSSDLNVVDQYLTT